MTITIPLHAIELTPGSMISIPSLSWQDFEQILVELGEQRNTRITYYQGTLEIMFPLARHERFHRIIADIVKTILKFIFCKTKTILNHLLVSSFLICL
jgi:Uma2 family endonuclease